MKTLLSPDKCQRQMLRENKCLGFCLKRKVSNLIGNQRMVKKIFFNPLNKHSIPRAACLSVYLKQFVICVSNALF